MKWVAGLVLFLVIVGSVFITCAEGVELFKSGEYTYMLNEDGSAVITKYSGEAEKLTIPSELDEHTVKGIGNLAFSSCRSLTSITLPDSVTELGFFTPWSNCENLAVVKISSGHPSLAVIDGVLYSKADKRLVWYPMTSEASAFEVPNGIRAIGGGAFYGCCSLTSITLPDSVTSIGPSAFYGCSSLTSIIIMPNSITNISRYAFYHCTSMTSITLPDSLTSIGDGAFLGCSSLTTITLPDSITSIGRTTFADCTSLTSITLPDSVTSIGDWAFSGCTNLTLINLPDGITSIGDWAFSGCHNLTSIILPDSVTTIGKNAFDHCENLILIASENSYAEQYCINNGLLYTFPNGSLDWLND